MSSAPAKSNHEHELSTPASAATTSRTSQQRSRLPLNRYVIFVTIAAIGLAADLVTKGLVFDRYFDPQSPMFEPAWWIDGVLGVQTSTNGGALFGLGQGGSHWFALLSMIALGAILYWLFVRQLAWSRWLNVALAFITGGILGNFYDRIGLGYRTEWDFPQIRNHVRDWIHFRWEGVWMLDPWPNFNIADSLLVTGAIMLFIFAFFGKPPETEIESEAEPSNQAADQPTDRSLAE